MIRYFSLEFLEPEHQPLPLRTLVTFWCEHTHRLKVGVIIEAMLSNDGILAKKYVINVQGTAHTVARHSHVYPDRILVPRQIPGRLEAVIKIIT